MENNEFKIGGYFTFSLIRDGEVIDSWEDKNIVVDAGLNYILDSALSVASQTSAFYIGLFSNNYTPISTTTISALTEVTTAYTEATRPVWSESGVTAKTITNSASPATFTFNTTATIYGAFLCNNSVKGNTAATTVIAASRFAASRSVVSGDILNITYTISASST